MNNVDGLKVALKIAEQIKKDFNNSVDINILIDRLKKELEKEYLLFNEYNKKQEPRD